LSLIEIDVLTRRILFILYALMPKLFLESHIVNAKVYIVVNRNSNESFNQDLTSNFAIIFILFLNLIISRFRFTSKNLRSAILQQASIMLNNRFCNLRALIIFLSFTSFLSHTNKCSKCN